MKLSNGDGRVSPLHDIGFDAPLKRGVLVVAGLHHASQSAATAGNLIRFAGDWQPDRIIALAPQYGWCGPATTSCGNFAAFLNSLARTHEHPVVIQTNSLPPPGTEALTWSDPCAAAIRHNNAVLHTGILLVAPGWYSICANDGPRPGYPGALAIGLARALRASVICGGTLMPGVVGESSGTATNERTLWGVEVGTAGAAFMPAPATEYGFMILEPDGQGAAPTTVPIGRDGSFTACGVTYR